MVSMILSDEQYEFKEVIHDFLVKEVVPFRAEWDRAEAIDLHLVPKLGSMGVLGLTLAESEGGSGGDHITYALAMEELGWADSSVRGLVSVSLGLVAKSIAVHGTTEQRSRWLPSLAEGSAIGCFALTEPDSGSDAASLRTRATRVGDDYVLNGTKMFITNGTWADVCLVFARTGQPGPKGISAFLAPTASPGLVRRSITGKLGLRGQATAELSFQDVRLPAEARLGAEGEGFRIAMSALDKGRISVAAGCVGIMRACLELATEYARSRTQFGRPIASFQLVQDVIADISVETDAARMLVWRAAELVDRGDPFGVAAAKAKFYASEGAVRAANQAIQVFGGYGYIDEYPVEKLLRDSRVMTLYEGTSQIQKLLIGRAETGIGAFA